MSRSKHIVSAVVRVAVLWGQEGTGLSERPLVTQGGQLVTWLNCWFIVWVVTSLVRWIVTWLVMYSISYLYG